jgi:hypothetical protein
MELTEYERLCSFHSCDNILNEFRSTIQMAHSAKCVSFVFKDTFAPERSIGFYHQKKNKKLPEDVYDFLIISLQILFFHYENRTEVVISE